MAFALPALTLVAKLPTHPLILGVLNNAAHAPVLGILAIVILALLRLYGMQSRSLQFFLAFVLTVATGGAIELIQPLIGRGAALVDLWNDSLGAVVGLTIAALWESRLAAPGSGRRWPFVLVLIVAASIVIWPVAKATIAYAYRMQRFPTLFVDESTFDRYFIRTRGVATAHLEPSGLLIRITGGRWPGITLVEPQADWRGYSRLMLDLTNPGDRPLTLNLRVHDLAHDNQANDRFNQSVTLAAASRTVLSISLAEIARAPTGRQLDLSRIAGLILFADGGADSVGREFHLTRIWLAQDGE